jgi:hypothetical protein
MIWLRGVQYLEDEVSKVAAREQLLQQRYKVLLDRRAAVKA